MKQISLTPHDLGKYCPKRRNEEYIRPEVKRDWALERRLLPNIKHILADYFIVQDIEIDMLEGVDFLLSIKSAKIGARLRRYSFYIQNPIRIKSKLTGKYYDYFPREEFTIRLKRRSGVNTEYDKYMSGFVDFFIYGFVNPNEERIIQWFLGDLNIFRNIKPEPIDTPWNKDYRSQLGVWKLKSLPESFICDSFNLP